MGERGPVMLEKLLETGRPVIADGSWSTQLVARGFPRNVAAETANVTQAELVAGLARAYLEAGARVLTTNTFGANRAQHERRGVKWSVEEINRAGAEIALEAASGFVRGALRQGVAGPAAKSPRSRADSRRVGATTPSVVVVVGTVGPTGKLMVVKEVEEREIEAIFEQQIGVLAESGVQAIVLETFSELAEILLAVRVAKRVCKQPVIASMSFDSGPQRTMTMMGAEAGQCAAALEEAGADLVGCNCGGGGAAGALPAVVALRAATKRPLWVKPSAGLPEMENGVLRYPTTPDEFAEQAAVLAEAGANVIGGCCGVGPEHVRRLAKVLR